MIGKLPFFKFFVLIRIPASMTMYCCWFILVKLVPFRCCTSLPVCLSDLLLSENGTKHKTMNENQNKRKPLELISMSNEVYYIKLFKLKS